jgi:shikimate kinase
MSVKKMRNIILCGFMATGKSSVGRQLAAKTGFEFLDMDSLIEAEAGMNITQIFETQGEPAFRAMESRMIERVAERTECVVATGGGAIVNPANLQKLKSCGVVVTLAADADAILRRAANDDTRPLLRVNDRLERIQTLLKQREPFYSQADIVLDTSSLTVEGVVNELMARLRKFGYEPEEGDAII